MAAAKIMVIRHAEKPDATKNGVTESGELSPLDLTARGWQRAGALACLFAPTHGPLPDPRLARPEYLFAARASGGAGSKKSNKIKSRRSEATLRPLAEKLNSPINIQYSKGQEEELVCAALACAGVVLIAWKHEAIRHIANAILGNPTAPQEWPADCFDLIYVFTLEETTGEYRFDQVPQCLLAGDRSEGITCV
jgi:hypothetical protein